MPNKCIMIVFALLFASTLPAGDLYKYAEAYKADKEKSCKKIAEMALTENDWAKRIFVVMELTDHTVLDYIAKTDDNESVRGTAMKNLSDQTVLADIAKTDDQEQSVPKAQVRTDGLYYIDIYGSLSDPDNPLYYKYIRFYDDGSGITVMSADRPPQIIQWLTKEKRTGEYGSYSLSDNTLTFVVPTETGSRTLSCLLTKDACIARPNSNYPMKYAFFEINPSADKQAPEQNHFPIVLSKISVENRIILGSQGEKVGCTTTVEVNASDPDGDPLFFTWKAENGSITSSGRKVVWERIVNSAGAIQEGMLVVEIKDDKGGITTRGWDMRSIW